MPLFLRNHIIVNGRTASLPYTSPNTGRSKVKPRPIGDRQAHGTNIKQQFEQAVEDFGEEYNSEFVYIVFKSPIDVLLDIDKFDKGKFRLASYKKASVVSDDENLHDYYEATVYLNRRAIGDFLRKIDAYITKTTPITYNTDGTVKGGGKPLNNTLIANIEEIRVATLQSFWQEPELAFPTTDEELWWEVWLSRDNSNNTENLFEELIPLIERSEIQIGEKILEFPEHWICLMRCTRQRLGKILYSNRLSEIRKPRDLADFFMGLEHSEQADLIANLVERVDNLSAESNISVCLLDTGVNRTHPLLINLIPEKNLDSVNPAWSRNDGASPFGHGTPMACLALYGDLTDILGNTNRVKILHHLESIKLINDSASHEPALYGAITQEAIARGEIINPNFKRVVCMAVTSDEIIHRGRPTSWSAAIDQKLFGTTEEPNTNLLVIVSSGNVPLEERINYPIGNADFTIEDPAQSYNALTVGAYTLKDFVDHNVYSGAEIMANRGAMSPCNTTSIGWLHEWCKKPDVVMEGGNIAMQLGGIIEPQTLQLLSASRGGIGRSLLTTFRDTSASTALAAKFAAELYAAYPNFRPETIRALIVHSADWTPAMLNNRTISQLTSLEKEKLFAHVGYGVPNMEKARYSANNSLSMIFERTLVPFKLDGSRIKTNEFHLFDLPWPTEVLEELFETPVKFKITLSYFIEPNPGNKQYELSSSYKSCGLRFKMINSLEKEASFRGRVSKALRQADYTNDGTDSWILGTQLRDKGSIHKDIWEGTAADLATRNKIAVYPVGGWWKNRKKLDRYNVAVNYSLIMTIETQTENTDIFTPVENLISIDIE